MSHDREFDVIMYGSTGYTGRLVAEYLAQNYTGDVRWAMAGRSAEKLAAVRDEIGAPADTPLIVADADDPQSLADMVARANASRRPWDHISSMVNPWSRPVRRAEPTMLICAASRPGCAR